MKKLSLTFTILFSILMISTPSYGEWTKVVSNGNGDNFYIDFDRIRKHDGYIYYWELTDYLKPHPSGVLSGKAYKQGDCNEFRQKFLSLSFHKEPMGRGLADIQKPAIKSWMYIPPDSASEIILNSVCSVSEVHD